MRSIGRLQGLNRNMPEPLTVDVESCQQQTAQQLNATATAHDMQHDNQQRIQQQEQAGPDTSYVLALWTVERCSCLWFHVHRAWVGAHMRRGLTNAGAPGERLYVASSHTVTMQCDWVGGVFKCGLIDRGNWPTQFAALCVCAVKTLHLLV